MLSPLVVDDRYHLAGGCRSSDGILVPPAGASSLQRGFVRHGIDVVSMEITSSVGWHKSWTSWMIKSNGG